jgi:hypothetical protein
MSYINPRLVEERLRELHRTGERAARVAGKPQRREARGKFSRLNRWRIRRSVATVVE